MSLENCFYERLFYDILLFFNTLGDCAEQCKYEPLFKLKIDGYICKEFILFRFKSL